MRPFYETVDLHFSCTGCGRCCATAGDYYVFLSRAEAERIRIHLGLSAGWFRRRYLDRLADGDLVLAGTAGDACIFLGEDRRCRIYPVRPVQCRTYPFWPELVTTGRAWRREQRRCEGVGRGAAVPLSRIRRAVRACSEQVDQPDPSG
jgi:Fe-S-cluster containining protein